MAYCSDHSTVDQFIAYVQPITDGFHCKPSKSTAGVFTEMSAVFYKVWRQKLLGKLHEIGIKGKAFLWIRKFLSNRSITVKYNGVLLEKKKAASCSTTRFSTKPLLFIIYTIGLKNNLR